jgi:hypothetical protein
MSGECHALTPSSRSSHTFFNDKGFHNHCSHHRKLHSSRATVFDFLLDSSRPFFPTRSPAVLVVDRTGTGARAREPSLVDPRSSKSTRRSGGDMLIATTRRASQGPEC